eukprot:6202211-Pyramimonas_sp.AAC.1
MSLLFEAVERLGSSPMQLPWMLLPLLEKAKGGLRPTLLLAAPVRIWERLGRPEVDGFLVRAHRAHWSFGEGQSSEAAVWQQIMLAEEAQSQGKVAAGFIWDGTKYDESFWLSWLRVRAEYWGIPRVLAKTLYNIWRSPRILRLGAHHSPLPLFAESGLPAGDIYNDVFVKVYTLFEFDQFAIRNPRVPLGSHIDDDTILTFGEEEKSIQDLVRAAYDM